MIPTPAPQASPAALAHLLLAPARPARVLRAILGLAAVAVGIAGFLHGRLFHEGYSQVTVIGPLFLLNELSSGVVVALLLLRRPWLFALGSLGISVGAVVSIVISHTTSLFGFAEHRYDGRATTIVVCECVATGLVLLALGLAARLGLGIEETGRAEQAERTGKAGPTGTATRTGEAGLSGEATRAGEAGSTGRAGHRGGSPMTRRVGEIAALVIVLATALVAVGVGQGAPPPAFALSHRAVRAEIAAVAGGSALARRGESLFGTHGCGDCHTMAAGGYGGRLGPRLDAILQGTGASTVEQDIVHPPHGVPGYEAGLMPEDFGSRLPRGDVRALTAFIHAAAQGAAAAGSGR